MKKLYKFSLSYAKQQWSITEVDIIKETEKRITIKDSDRSWVGKDQLDKNIRHYNVTIYSESSDINHFKALVLQDLNRDKEELTKKMSELDQNLLFIKGLN